MAAVRLDAKGAGGIGEESVAGGGHAGLGFLAAGELVRGEFGGEELGAVRLEHFLDVDLGAAVGVAGVRQPRAENSGFEVEPGADGRARHLDGLGGFDVFDPERIVVAGGGKNREAVESLGAGGGGFAGMRGGVEGFEADERGVLGLEETQRVAQDREAVLGAPNRQGGFRLVVRSVSGVAEEGFVVRSPLRAARAAPLVGLSLLRAECGTRGRGMVVDSE